MRWEKISIALGAALLAGSCSPPDPIVIAAMEGGKLVFHLREQGFVETVFGYDDDAMPATNLTVSDIRGTVMWQLGELTELAPACAEGAYFPIEYGAERCGLPTVTAAQILVPGTAYYVEASIDPLNDSYLMAEEFNWHIGAEGSFRLTENGVVNLRR
jgi:hypothetical protein